MILCSVPAVDVREVLQHKSHRCHLTLPVFAPIYKIHQYLSENCSWAFVLGMQALMCPTWEALATNWHWKMMLLIVAKANYSSPLREI